MFFLHRTLREIPDFTEQMQELGEVQHIDEALNALTWALATNAEQYPIISGTTGLRVARSKQYQRGPVFVPALSIWFVIKGEVVELRMITQDRPDDEAF